ncbi:MAG: hypothetical protein IT303_14835 [Dehalococcoidia bacterium]|nr:hypothetical protein [Dehalococcoidia bacterium]
MNRPGEDPRQPREPGIAPDLFVVAAQLPLAAIAATAALLVLPIAGIRFLLCRRSRPRG